MMIVAACTSVGRGPSDARPEHFRAGGYRNIIVFKDSIPCAVCIIDASVSIIPECNLLRKHHGCVSII